MNKEILRAEYLKKRMEFLSSDKHPEFSASISESLASLLKDLNLSNNNIISLYKAARGEVNIKQELLSNFKIAYPSLINIKNKLEIQFLEINKNTKFSKSRLGFNEPVENAFPVIPTILIVPGTVFDKNCNRIGYGMAHYDTYLNKLSKLGQKVIKIGVAFEFQVVDEIDVSKHDVPLDFVVTESNIYKNESLRRN